MDIYASIVWGGIIRYREAHSLVRYPSEVDDEFITPYGYGLPSVSPESSTHSHGDSPIVSRQPVSWMHGWNFTTDLYRMLEHVVDGTRRRFSSANGTTEVWPLFGPVFMSEPTVMERVLSMYNALPPQFRETPPITGDMSKDLFGFQSANIQATLQLLRMVLLSAEEIGVDRKCDVAGELLSVFTNVPIEYLKAISSPLVSSYYFIEFLFISLTHISFITLVGLGTSLVQSWREVCPTPPIREYGHYCKLNFPILVKWTLFSKSDSADWNWQTFSTVWRQASTAQQVPANAYAPRLTESTGTCVHPS